MNMHFYHKIYGIIFFIFMGYIFYPVFSQQMSHEFNKQTIIKDKTMIVPGVGSDGVILGENIETVFQRFGKKRFRISQADRVDELFQNVFKVQSETKLYFDAVCYNEADKFAVCVFQGTVIAVIGFDINRVTIDRANLRAGINNFIFNYGNRGLAVIRGGNNKIYMYRDIGIAAVDDNSNDMLDLYIVFGPPNGTR
jgi:hypothetical protein